MQVTNCTVKELKSIVESVGNRIGSVHFVKRSDGTLRKMCYRLHVKSPTFASPPTKMSHDRRRQINDSHDQVTVFDVNKVIGYDESGRAKRGAWRTIPLDNIVRVKVNGIEYQVEK